MVKMNVMSITDSQDFGMMNEHLKVVAHIRFAFGIILSPKLGDGGPLSQALENHPRVLMLEVWTQNI
jgi:hypothetical protein